MYLNNVSGNQADKFIIGHKSLWYWWRQSFIPFLFIITLCNTENKCPVYHYYFILDLYCIMNIYIILFDTKNKTATIIPKAFATAWFQRLMKTVSVLIIFTRKCKQYTSSVVTILFCSSGSYWNFIESSSFFPRCHYL